MSAQAVTRSGRGHGPSAFGGDARRFVNLTTMLAITDFKLKFFGSALGYFWSLMRPLMLFGVLYFVFNNVLKFGTDVKFYPVYLLTSIVLWTFFAETTSGGVTALITRESLLRKVRFPRMVIPLAVALTALFNFAMNLVAVFVFALISGVRPHWGWLGFPLLVLALIVLSTGFAMLLSALYVRYRDISPIWDVVLQILFYASPILYVIGTVPANLQAIMMCNPIATVLTQMRHWVLDPSAPTAAQAIGGAPRLLVPFGICAVVLVVGLWFFNREAPRIAENL